MKLKYLNIEMTDGNILEFQENVYGVNCIAMDDNEIRIVKNESVNIFIKRNLCRITYDPRSADKDGEC